MKKLKYLIERILTMNFKNFFEVIKKVHVITKKSKFLIFWDIIFCGIFFQAGYSDYLLFAMYDLNYKERKTILTRGVNNEYIKRYNPKEYWHLINNKDEFNALFKNYLNRDYILIHENEYDKFADFVKIHKKFIAKPLAGSCGNGIKKIDGADYKDKKALFYELLENKTTLLEEIAIQHPKMQALHPASINTVRIVTLKNEYDVTSIVAAFVRIGTNGKVVDNFNNDGICAPVNLEKGFITAVAINKKRETFNNHPTTGVALIGYQLPMWDEVKKLVIEASKVVPQLGIIGWDVCIGVDKPFLIEANQFPGHDIYQLPEHRKNNMGVKPIFEEAIHRKK